MKNALATKLQHTLPDNAQWCNRFEVRSETSNRVYIVSQNKAGRWWACSCMGWIRFRKCKHLRALELPCYQQPFEIKAA